MVRSPAAQSLLDDEAVDEEIPVAALEHPRLAGLYRHWNDRRGPLALPARASFQPEGLAPFLGYIALVDVEDQPRRFRYRLIGTEIVKSYGIELTGQYTDVIQPPIYLDMIERHYGQAVDRGEPVAHRMSFVEGPGKVHDLVRLTLPLSDDGRQVNMLMLTSLFGPEIAWYRERRRSEQAGLRR